MKAIILIVPFLMHLVSSEVEPMEPIVFSISEDVPPDNAQQTLMKLKEWIKEGSEFLYQSTYGMSQFPAQVKILLPPSWPAVSLGASQTEVYNHNSAEFKLEPLSGVCNSYPRAVGSKTVCGAKKEYVSIPMGFFKKADEKSMNKRVFAREWIKYYYGVFDEFGCPKDTKFPVFFSDSRGVNLPIYDNERVPNGVPKDIRTGGQCEKFLFGNYNPYCSFAVDQSGANDDITDFFMGLPTLKNNLYIGQDSKNNPLIKTPQNFYCCGQSVYSMIKNHPSTAQNASFTVPEIELVYQAKTKVVFVVDTSGSMYGTPNKVLMQATAAWVQSLDENVIDLAMVRFSSSASSYIGLTNVDDSTKYTFLSIIASFGTSGGTNIKSGVEQGLSELGSGGVMVIMTDGVDNSGYDYVAETRSQIISSGVKIITMAFGEDADQGLEELARISNGASYYAPTTSSGVGDILETLSQALSFRPSEAISEKTVELKHGMATDVSSTHEFYFMVDDTVGNNTQIVVSSKGSGDVSSVCINYQGRCTPMTTTTTSIMDIETMPAGNYTVTVTVTTNTDLTYTVKTKAASEMVIHGSCNARVINNNGKYEVLLQGKILSGYKPIANASVMAYIQAENSEDVYEVYLMDYGVGPDLQMNDGIYTGTFTQFDRSFLSSGETQLLRYKMDCRFHGTENSYILDESTDALASNYPCCESRDSYPESTTPVSKDFTRYASGGSFQYTVKYEDDIAPGRVQDLTFTTLQVLEDNYHILFWTAMGDDAEHGVASEYIIRYSASKHDLYHNFDNQTQLTEADLDQGSFDTVEGGNTVACALPEKFKYYYIAVKTKDDANLVSKISNIATLNRLTPPKMTSPNVKCLKQNALCSATKSNTFGCIPSAPDCQELCQVTDNCTYFSYNANWKLCKLLEVSGYENKTCVYHQDFVTGPKFCQESCLKFEQSILDEALGSYGCIPSSEECQKVCQTVHPNCNYFSYVAESETCSLFETKVKDVARSGSMFGTKECEDAHDPSAFTTPAPFTPPPNMTEIMTTVMMTTSAPR